MNGGRASSGLRPTARFRLPSSSYEGTFGQVEDRASDRTPSRRCFPPPTALDEVRPLEMRTVVRGTREGRLWNEFVARYHYLGYKTLVGAQMRYAVHDRNGWPLAMLGFSTAAWKLAPRDTFIGWTPEKREKNLPLVVDNPRCPILPWIEIPNRLAHPRTRAPPAARGPD